MKNIFLFLVSILVFSCNSGSDKPNSDEHGKADHNTGASKVSKMHYANETHLKNVKQVTFGGDNAEAYWSFDDKQLVFQVKNEAWGTKCDQIYVMDADEDFSDGHQADMVSTGKGRTTCAYFMQGDSTILYASTHLKHEVCPPAPKRGDADHYVWPIYPEYDVFVADLEGNIVKQLTDGDGYDAEATVSPDGEKIVFTSTRSGDLELYIMDKDGSNIIQITNELGYDGGAFFSPDGSMLVYRSSRPKTEEEIKTYKDLLAKDLVMPTEMEIYVCNVDGTGIKKVTNLGGANWAPFFHPDGKKILFSSNHKNVKKGIPFNLFMVDLDGGNLEQITYDTMFDSFPMFSYDGKKLVWGSNRHNGGGHDTNLFIADWVD